MPKISINQGKCIGCGSCASICPKTFELKNNKAHVKKSGVGKITCEKQAADACPAGAISIS